MGATLSERKEMSFAEVVKMVESAKVTWDSVTGTIGFNPLSEQQRKKQGKILDQKVGGNTGEGQSNQPKCDFCGRRMHERSECPAQRQSVTHTEGKVTSV